MKRKLHLLILCSFITLLSVGQAFHNEWIDYNKPYYKFKVFGFGVDAVNVPIPKGMVRIPFSTLSSAGLAGTPAEQFQLWRDGEEVPVYTSAPSGAMGASDYIEFWGEINNGKLDKELYREVDFQLSDKWSLQTDTAAYFLTVNPAGANKRLVNAANNVAGNTRQPAPYFMYTVGRHFRAELINGFSAVAGHNLYSSSYDRGEGFVSRRIRPNGNTCGGQAQLPQNFSALYPYLDGPEMVLNLNTVGDAVNSRSVKVLLNNDSLTTYQMDYFYDAKVEEYFPVSKLSSGNANFTVINQSSVGCDEMRISKIELTYPRQFNMGGASNFEFNVEGSSQGTYLAITNFNYGGVAPILYDLENGKRYVVNISNPDTLKVVLLPTGGNHRLVLTTQAGTYYKTISTVQQRNFVNYGVAANQGDYLIISNPLIYGTGSSNYVQQYKDYRESPAGGNYVPQIVDVDELVDQFAWGQKKHPLSVKNFLRYARSIFATKPKFAFLIGKGVSYNNYKANESDPLIDKLNLVPTWGYPASDNLLSSEDEKAIPATPIGRLSAVTPQEVGDYLQKVKQYDSVQTSPSYTIEGRAWMKNVLQIAGANDLSLGNQLNGYMQNYGAILNDTAFGAKVTNYNKTVDPAGYTDAVVSFKKTYEHGSSLITYFGHSSATSLDFNLDNPEAYNNPQKYPMFIVNGCLAGNFFEFEPNRFSVKTTISEKFVLANQKGAIGYLASTNYGVVNYLDIYTKEFYKAIGKTKYNQPIGVAVQEGITQALANTGYADYYSRVHSEQYALHGDPAIRFNTSALPDFVVEEPQIEVSPSFVSAADTSFTVKVRVYNIGRGTNDSVSFKLNRQLPNGKTVTVFTKQLSPIDYVDSVIVKLPIIANRDKGLNVLYAVVDYNNSLNELSNTNNSAFKNVMISEDEIRPIFPYKNAIVNTPNIKFKASTVNPLSASRDYVMEIDTTDFFNSPLKATSTVTSVGGVIEFTPSITLQNNKVYYWRVAPVLPEMHWSSASFRYESASLAGFEQADFYQHTKATFDRIYIDSVDRQFKFKHRTNNLFIVNSIYPTSGLEDGQFSVTVNGSQMIASACDGPAFQFNVFNPITFQPWKNRSGSVGLSGSISVDCGVSRQYNFDFLSLDKVNRYKAMRFMDSIPNGYFVVVRVVASPEDNVNTYPATWMSDTATYGFHNSVYYRLKDQGFATIDSFNRPRTFSFVYKKNDTTFAPQYVMSDGVNDRINLNVNCTTPDTLGYIISEKYGPAKNWKTVKWAGSSLEANNDRPTLEVVGSKTDGTENVLYRLNTSQQNFDISSVNSNDYPFIQLRLRNQDSITATPYQLSYYKVEYDASPEGGIAPNLYFNIPDTVGLVGTSDSLHIEVAYKNASLVNFDSLSVRLVLYDTLNNAFEIPLPKTRPVAAEDTVHIKAAIDVSALRGWYNVYLQVNPNDKLKEQYNFNNWLYKYVYITAARVLPVTLLNFNAQLQGDDVQTTWSVAQENNTLRYEVQHSTNGAMFSTIGTVNGTNNGSANDYQFVHAGAPAGKNYYRLRIIDKDGSAKFSAVRLITKGRGVIVNIFPNPVKDKLSISISRADGKPSSVKLLNTFGQQLLQKKVTGSAVIDMAAYSSGIYLVQVDDGVEVKTYKIQKQ